MLKNILTIQLLLTTIIVTAQPSSGKVAQRVTKDQHIEFLRKSRAESMADSLTKMLNLNKSVREQLLKTNLLIEDKKLAAWKTHSDRKVLTDKLQLIENQRNELYKKILSSDDYLIYINSKKRKGSKIK